MATKVESKLEALSGDQEQATIKQDDRALARVHKQAQNLTARYTETVCGHRLGYLQSRLHEYHFVARRQSDHLLVEVSRKFP